MQQEADVMQAELIEALRKRVAELEAALKLILNEPMEMFDMTGIAAKALRGEGE